MARRTVEGVDLGTLSVRSAERFARKWAGRPMTAPMLPSHRSQGPGAAVHGSGMGSRDLYDIRDLDQFVERLKAGDHPPLLPCEVVARDRRLG